MVKSYFCFEDFCWKYCHKIEKGEIRDGSYFNKVGPNKKIHVPIGTFKIPYIHNVPVLVFPDINHINDPQPYKFDEYARDLFYKGCANFLYEGKKLNEIYNKEVYYLNFAQYLPEIAPLCLDFDLVCKFVLADRKKIEEKRELHIYDFKHIVKIVEILNNIIYDNFEIEKEEIKAYVQEKEEFKFKAKEQVKDGLHIIYLLPFSVAERFFIRDELIKKLKEIDFIKSFNFEITNSYEEIVDEAVIERNPWLTYGSIKVTSKKIKDANGNIIYYTDKKDGKKKARVEFEHSLPYKLTHIFDFDLYDENYDALGNMLTYDTEEELEDLMNLFDLDQFSDEDPLDAKTEKAEEFIENWEREDKEKKERIKSYKSKSISISTNSNSGSEKYEKIIFPYTLDTKTLFKMVELLKKNKILYTDYNIWFKICCELHKNFTDHKIPEEDIKKAILDFSKCWDSFDLSDFEDDKYPKIIKCASTHNYSLEKSLNYIKEIDFEKYNKLVKVVKKNFKKKGKSGNNENDLTNFFSFNNYKKNNYSNMDSSDSNDSNDKEIQNDNQLSAFERYERSINNYNEQHKDDEIEYVPKQIPELPNDEGKTLDGLIKYIKDLGNIGKNEVMQFIGEYLFKRVLFVQGDNNYYVYDFENKVYIGRDKKFITDYILDNDLVIKYHNKEGEKKTISINPLKLFKNYIKFNHWERRRDINQPKLYKELKYVNGKIVESKNIFNDGPSIPSYLTENYKKFDEYGQKYKDFVKGFFLLLKYSLCDGKEEDYEYLKNWVINKALFKRNRTVLVLQSPGQGIGKSTVAQMIKAMCEDKYVSIGNKCDWLNEKFNSILKDKILIGVEEMTISDSKAVWKTMLNRMKDLTTNISTVLEFKGKEPFDADIEFDFVITSNYYNNFANDVENRRYFIPNVTANKYKEIPTFKPEILNTHPITIKENGIPKKVNEIKNIDQLCKYLNGIIINKGNSDTHLSKYEKRKYFRCFYAYCNENKNEDFEPSFMPMTDEIKQSADKTMKFIYKYIKIKELYGKSHLITKKDKEGKIISSDIKFITTDIKYDIKDFAYSLYKNECTLRRYNYINSCVYEFFKEIGLPEKNNEASEITSQKINDCFKRYFNNYIQYKKVKSRKTNCYVFECSYNELLEFYKSSGYIIDSEYEKLKDNYDILKYCEYNEYLDSSSNNYYEQVNELKQKLNEKDNLLKKQDKEIESIKNTNEQQDKEIESLKNANEQKDKEIEKLKAELEELKKLSLKTKEIKKSDIEDKKIEELKKECRDLLDLSKGDKKPRNYNDLLRSMASKCRQEGGLNIKGAMRDYKQHELIKILSEYSGYVEEEKN